MDCAVPLGLNIAELNVIGRIALLSILVFIGIVLGWLLNDHIGRKQEKDNLDYIADLKETIRFLNRIDGDGDGDGDGDV